MGLPGDDMAKYAYTVEIHPGVEAETDALLELGRELKVDLGRAICQIDDIAKNGVPDGLRSSTMHAGYELFRIYMGRIVLVFGINRNRLVIACVREFTTTYQADTALNQAKLRLALK